MNKNIIITFAFLLFAMVSFADGYPKNDKVQNTNIVTEDDFLLPDGFFNINYNLGIGIGDLREFINENSYRGFNIDARYFLNNKFTLGGYLGWTGFYEKFDRKSYNFESGSITGVGATTYYNFTMGLNAHYYPIPSGLIKPYIGLNAGPLYQTVQVQVGKYYVEDQNWQFMFAPELGVFIPFGPDSQAGINTGVRYSLISYHNTNYGFDNGLHYLQFFVGISFEY